MFERFLKWISAAVTAMFAIRKEPAREVRPSVGNLMSAAIELWSRLYQNDAPWKAARRNLNGLGLPAAIAAELARQTVLEMTCTCEGSARADYLSAQLEPVLARLREAAEYGCAKGGLIFKPYPDGMGGISVDLVQADRFAPVGFDSRGRLTAAVFTEQLTRGRQIYTRYEYHELTQGRYTIRNIAYLSTSHDMQGSPIALATVPEWEGLSDKIELTAVERPLFGYFRAPSANTIDPGSPLGVSVYARAVDLIRQADEQWERILWEYEGGELAVDASEDIFRMGEDGKYKLPKGKERLYRLHDAGIIESGNKFIETFAPPLRDISLFNGLNNIFKRIEFNCGLAYGTLSDPQNVDKTAEEIRAAKQRSYATVADIQRALEAALRDLMAAMDVYATLYSLAPSGGYNLSLGWDDSILTDSATQRMQDKEDVRDGILQPWEYRVKWYGEDEQTARSRVATTRTDDEWMGFRGGGG